MSSNESQNGPGASAPGPIHDPLLPDPSDPVLEGTAGNDTINGTDLADEIFGYAGNDWINGLGGDDIIHGGAGNDTLVGGSGNDTLYGGTGNDTYYLDTSADLVYEAANEGTDTVYASFSYTLGDNLENATLWTMGGTQHHDYDLTGNGLDNVLTGNDGNNVLNGLAGADTMIGGGGNDTYYVDNVNDQVVETSQPGVDTVFSTVSYSLSNHVDHLALSGGSDIDATGNGLSNFLTGNAGDNVLTGLGGNDVLAGGGGADTLIGGTGDDEYRLTGGNDTVVEQGGEGDDLVIADSSYALTANVERLELTGSGNIDATGNGLDNTLTGNSGDNTLDGGAGSDTMIGGAGDDIYIVDKQTETIVELANEGTDTVHASTWHTLADNVENLVITGSNNTNGAGNALDNTITGNDGNNTIYGHGGNDTMIGGKGDDTYVVNDAGDTVVELGNEGTDTVRSWVSYNLSGNLENLTLLGSGNTNGTGNWRANTIEGNAGNNLIIGGAGDDMLTGGAGGDIFQFNTGHGQNAVTDFETGTDHLKFVGTSAAEFADLTLTEENGDLRVAVDDISVLLEDISLAEFDAGDVLFS